MGRANWMRWLLLLVAVSVSAGQQNHVDLHDDDHNHNPMGCDCMEYWACITSGGSAYSYCGNMDQSVCCYVPRGARPIGLLPVLNKSKCGRKGNVAAAVGDRKRTDGLADLGEWPWHAAVLEKPQDLYVCGASLLDESWVVTAAHCVDDYLASSNISSVLKVRLGEYDVSVTTEQLAYEELDVSHVMVHPQFNNLSLANDIALLRFVQPARRRPHIDVVCMPHPGQVSETEGTRCVVTGWGRKLEDGTHSVILKEIEVPLWDDAKCQAALRTQFGPNFVLPPSSICAGAEGRDACDGDGGGPLVCEKEGQWFQVGVVSFGIGCGRTNLPGVYTRLSAFDGWIHETIRSFKTLSG
ncbi:phenoloxidase-activating factor 2-like [Daphnia carinata]|uniref:phenoloxidase-activating factor 2-like n=1 Tax=Daphnia carinata TaxID=120202 RepID=UPI00257B2AB1|nr:phenoloxidase-activating factor 2-like [Daphnia carinata]